MKIDEKKARAILGLTDLVLSAANINTAFAVAMKANHPDTTTQAMENLNPLDPGDNCVTAWTADSIKAARDYLRQVVTGADKACKTCRGHGVVRARMGTTPCGACGGTGAKR